jgi:hypothetical protein
MKYIRRLIKRACHILQANSKTVKKEARARRTGGGDVSYYLSHLV